MENIYPMRNEILRLLNNISHSGFGNNVFICDKDEKANQIFYTINRLTRNTDHPIIFDKNSNGSLKPDIIAYLCPDFSKGSSAEEFLRIEDDMPLHQVGIEHFYISNYSYVNRSKKVTSKIPEMENALFKDMHNSEGISIVKNYLSISIKDKVDIFDSFKKIYKKHYQSRMEYLNKIYERNFMGNAVTPIGELNTVPIWFLIECDDTEFINKEQSQEIPIFLTKQGYSIMNDIGFVDGYIYYGNRNLYIVSNEILKCMHKYGINEMIISPIIQKEYIFKNDFLCKSMGTYWKIVR